MTDSTYIKKFFIIFFVVLASVCEGQPSITWQRTYNGPQNSGDYSYGIAKSTPGTYFILGQSGGGLYLLKINDYGDTIWTRATSRAASAIASSGDGGCVLASSGYATKYDSNGNIVWGKDYMFSNSSVPQDIKKTSDGGYVCCSYYGIYDSQVFKIDSVGNLQWHKEYSSSRRLNFQNVLDEYNIGYRVVGTDSPPLGDTPKAVIYKLDLNGEVTWIKKYTIFGKPTSGLVLQSFNNKYLIAGSTLDSTGNKSRAYFLKVDSNGNTLYTKLFPYDSSHCEILRDFIVINLNRLVFSTITLSGNFCNNEYRARIFLCDTLGNISDSNFFTTSNYIEFKKILPVDYGDIIFAGVLESTFTNWEDIYIVRTDSNLNTMPLTVKNNASSIVSSFKLFQNYPNPFNPTTKIKFFILKNSKINLTIYDISGKETFKLITNTDYNKGYFEVEWDGSKFASGVYFYVMTTDNFKQSKKLILLK